MTPHKQLFRHDPDNNIYGDCWRTCIACLLNVEPDTIPHFYNKDCQDPQQAQHEMNRFLEASYGVKEISIPFDGASLDAVQSNFKERNDNLYYMLTGTSANGTNHCVICYNGEIIHDPALDNSGIVGPCDDGFYWISFLAFEEEPS